jgi:N utilization substance protein B
VDKRTEARELAMQALFQLDVQGNDLVGCIGLFFADYSDDKDVKSLAEKWCGGTWENRTHCDTLISESAKKWSLERLSLVDKSILRLSVYQLKFCCDIPPKVVINEAIEMAKKFGGEKSPAFVNGVLDAVLKKISADNSVSREPTVK